MAAVSTDGCAFEFKADKELVMKAVRSMECAADELKADKVVMKASVVMPLHKNWL